MNTKTKTWALFKSHFKIAGIDIRSQDTIGTAGYHGVPYAAANSTTTREADQLTRLTASELALPKPCQLHPSRLPSTHQPTCRPSSPIPLGYTDGLMVSAKTSSIPVLHVSILAKAIRLLNYSHSRNPSCARTDAQTNPNAQRATQLRSVLARVYSVSRQNLNTNNVP
jgi:hypothetical protein